VANKPENPFGIPGGLPTDYAMAGTKLLKRRRIRAPGAELLDSNGKAM
jgi:hypothetical protein